MIVFGKQQHQGNIHYKIPRGFYFSRTQCIKLSSVSKYTMTFHLIRSTFFLKEHRKCELIMNQRTASAFRQNYVELYISHFFQPWLQHSTMDYDLPERASKFTLCVLWLRFDLIQVIVQSFQKKAQKLLGILLTVNKKEKSSAIPSNNSTNLQNNVNSGRLKCFLRPVSGQRMTEEHQKTTPL